MQPATSPRAWTVLVYQDQGSSLRPHLEQNLRALADEGGDDRVTLAVQAGPSADGTMERRVLAAGQTSNRAEHVSADPRNPATLQQFLEWGMRAYPAERTMLVIGGHGEGWRGICTDGKGGAGMSVDGLRDAIAAAQKSTGKHVDILGFDACQMGQAEVVASLKETVPVVLASEELIGPAGWPYEEVVRAIKQHPESDALGISQAIVDRARADQEMRQDTGMASGVFTLAAYDMSQADAFLKATDNLAGAVLATDTPPILLRAAARGAQAFNHGIPHPPDSDYRDVVGFALQLLNSEDIDDEHLRDAARAVLRAAEKFITAEQHAGQPEAFGISAYLPLEPPPTDGYEKSALARTTRWSEMLRRLA